MYSGSAGNIRDKQRFIQKVFFENTKLGENRVLPFSQMKRRRNISPSDIDGVIDYNGEAFIYMEFKLKGKVMENAQRRAFKNIVDSHWRGGTKCLAMVCEHNIQDTTEIIKVEDTIVSEIYYGMEWQIYSDFAKTALDMIIIWENHCDNHGYKL